MTDPRTNLAGPTAQPESDSLVVVGSSAGGIEALATLIAALPASFPAPVVLAQHLDPRHRSHLAEILERHSRLPVRTVTGDEPLRPGVVYVVPADQHVEITDHVVRLRDQPGKRPKPSIDLLLSTAAAAFGERLIAVILTGSGSDGASGAHAVKAAGGTVVIENPATAAYPAMPASLAAATVDIVADLEQIGPLLADLLEGATISLGPSTAAPLQALLDQIRDRHGIDFTQYKQPTIERRLQRRLVATGLNNVNDYLHYLQSHPEEYARLVSSFLVKVTEFFRDPDLFAALRDLVIPDLIARARVHSHELRMWSAGCATGEEAYSLAILAAEALGGELSQFTVQIFATDLDEEAVAFARRGIYPAASVAGLPAELIARYFSRLDGAYEVSKLLRGQIIFGQHDLGQRAPFPRIDLVLCRNVLIYFTPELQRRALQLFAFALRDGGYLALGKAESVNPLAASFALAHDHLKLYRRQGERVLAPIARVIQSERGVARLPLSAPHHHLVGYPPSSRRPPAVPSFQAYLPIQQAGTVRESLDSLLLDLPVGVAVVGPTYAIQSINRSALRLLGIIQPAHGKDLVHLTTSISTAALRTAIDGAFQVHASSDAGREIVLSEESVLGEHRHLQIVCYPVVESEEAGNEPPRAPHVRAVVVLVSDVSSTLRARERSLEHAARAEADRQLVASHEQNPLAQAYQAKVEENERLRAQLAHMEQMAAVNQTLLDANQQLAGTNLELARVNEELLVGREEAEAANEEVKTLNEELQATNEELVTLNEEMEAAVEELHTANDDLQARTSELREMAASEAEQRQISEAGRAQLEAILLSMGDAVLVVAANGMQVLTNQAYAQLFGSPTAKLAAQDAQGHPLPPDATPQQRAARSEVFILEFVLTAADGSRRYYEASGQPIRSARGENDGGVVTIRDITERSQYRLQDQFLAHASHELRTPLTTQYAVLQLLARRLPSITTDKQIRHQLERVLDVTRLLTALVADLLDVGRLRTGKFTLQLQSIDLDAALRHAVENAQLAAEGQSLALDAPLEPVRVMGDALRLEQVFMNLLTNAIKYAPHTERIDVRLRRMGDMAEIQVRDYGMGIAADDLPHIFARLFQSTAARDTAPMGLGLGLYLAKELVQAHYGSITVESTEGKGTTFTVQLPLEAVDDDRPTGA